MSGISPSERITLKKVWNPAQLYSALFENDLSKRLKITLRTGGLLLLGCLLLGSFLWFSAGLSFIQKSTLLHQLQSQFLHSAPSENDRTIALDRSNEIINTFSGPSALNVPDAFSGRAMPRDRIVNGNPTWKSDSLVISITDAVPPRTGAMLRAYLLNEFDTGTSCDPLPVSDGQIETTCDFADQNLIAAYNQFRIMQEAEVLRATLSLGPMAELRKILASAEDTPNNIGYGPGLVKQAEIMATHAGFAVDALSGANSLANAKIHTEHALNVLYGSADARYGDQNNDGESQDPSSGYGVLGFTTSISLTMQAILNRSDVNENMRMRAEEVQTTLGNIGISSGGGLWAPKLIEAAAQVLAATTVEEAEMPAQTMKTYAALIQNGREFDDNGQIDPIENEGGAQTAYIYSRYAADYLPTTGEGLVRHQDSAANMYSDQLLIQIPSIPTAPNNEKVWVYLLTEDGGWHIAGSTTHNGSSIDTTLTLSGQNIAAQYHGVYVTTGLLYAEETLPTAPLEPLRQILARAPDTPINKGYGVGLVEQASRMADHAGFAVDALSGSNALANAKIHTEHVLNILYGADDERYGDQNNDGESQNPGDGFGVLRYSSRVSETMQLLKNTSGVTANMMTRANEVQTSLKNIGLSSGGGKWAPLVIDSATQLLAATTVDEAQLPAVRLRTFASRIRDGQEFNDNGMIEPIEDEGGAQTAYLYSQFAADYSPALQFVPEDTPTPTAVATDTPTATSTSEAPSDPTATPTPTTTATRLASAEGDNYEADNSCATASTISTNGTVQQHTFHAQADTDWVRFDAESGIKYLVEVQIPSDSDADAALELFTACEANATTSQDHAFSPGVRLQFSAPTTGPIFLKLSENNPERFGPDVAYHLSVRSLTSATGETELGAVIIVAGRLTSNDPLQVNITNAAKAFYQLYQEQGYDDDRIMYLNTDLSDALVDAKPTIDSLRNAITTWALDKVDANRALTMYLIDHGDVDRLYLDKPAREILSPDELDGWLTELETARAGVKTNIIFEMCHAGSFITGEQSISKANRLVLASTSEERLAYASESGAIFTDHLIPALRQRSSVLNSFQSALWAVNQFQPLQQPQLDGNGNGIPNEPADEEIAAQRGFSFSGSFPPDEWAPYVQSVNPVEIENGQAVIRARVLDDEQVERVWAVIYPPSYEPITEGDAMINELSVLPTIVLQSQGNNEYAATYTGFNEPGIYTIVIHSEDDSDLAGRAFTLQVDNGSQVLLPLIQQ
ncbi:MAG: hypothetical protein AAF702_01265 [Chloroflexota bacterium]